MAMSDFHPCWLSPLDVHLVNTLVVPYDVSSIQKHWYRSSHMDRRERMIDISGTVKDRILDLCSVLHPSLQLLW